MSQPEWLRDMAIPRVPHIIVAGPEAGGVRYLDPEEARAAAEAGTAISLEGRDMATFDLEQECIALQNRMLETAKRRRSPDGEEPKRTAPDAAEAVADDAAKPKRGARVGMYENRAMVTKPGKKD